MDSLLLTPCIPYKLLATGCACLYMQEPLEAALAKACRFQSQVMYPDPGVPQLCLSLPGRVCRSSWR